MNVTITITCTIEELPGVLKYFSEKVANPTEKNITRKNKMERKYADKICSECGNTFTPSGPATKKCQKCRGVVNRHELDKTLKEIEENRKKPYEFK